MLDWTAGTEEGEKSILVTFYPIIVKTTVDSTYIPLASRLPPREIGTGRTKKVPIRSSTQVNSKIVKLSGKEILFKIFRKESIIASMKINAIVNA